MKEAKSKTLTIDRTIILNEGAQYIIRFTGDESIDPEAAEKIYDLISGKTDVIAIDFDFELIQIIHE